MMAATESKDRSSSDGVVWGASQPPEGVLLVGSVPLPDAEAVFRTTSELLGSHVRRMPDGETGERTYWMVFQLALIAAHPSFRAPLGRLVRPFLRAYARWPIVRRVANAAMAGSQAGGTVLARVRPGVSIEDVRIGAMGYAEAAAASYSTFAQLKRQGVIPPHVRFQVALPTPLAPLDFFSRADQARLAPLYEARLLAEVQEIAASIPPNELAIQWDTAVEFAMLEGVWPTPFGSPEHSLGPIVEMLVRIGDAIPPEVELGYHLCYGDAAHKHFIQPRDTSKLAEVTRGIASGLRRPINWLHFPVPRNRSDPVYLEPMRDAALDSVNELYVGLVHATDGVSGATSRIATAQRVLERPFGVAAECGLGRREPESISALLRIHAAVAEPIGAGA